MLLSGTGVYKRKQSAANADAHTDTNARIHSSHKRRNLLRLVADR